MSMINCINEKQRRHLLSEMHSSIESLDDMIPRLSNAGASCDITDLLIRAREQIIKERSKMVAEMRKRGHE